MIKMCQSSPQINFKVVTAKMIYLLVGDKSLRAAGKIPDLLWIEILVILCLEYNI